MDTDEIAVALKYDPELADAPFVVAKGKGEIARRIVEIAQKSGVPVVKSPDLIHDLYRLGILEEIPEDLFVAVAKIIAFVAKL